MKMQNTKITEETKTGSSTAKELLSRSLQDLNGEKELGDTAAVAEKLNITIRTVEMYLGGNVAVIETGKAIFKTLRAIIIKRDNDIKKLVA